MNNNKKIIMKSPIPYYGGKYYLASKLLKYIPQHRVYIEVFGGGAQLLFRKKPSKVEIYNDIDKNLTTLFKILQKEELFKEFYQRIYFTPYSRQVYYECLNKLRKNEFSDEIERGYYFYVSLRQSVNSTIGSGWGYSITAIRGNMSSTIFSWIKAIERLPIIINRLKNVIIENEDFRDIILKYDDKDVFFYLDPPYVKETRNSKIIYLHEMSDKDHEDLVELILKCKGKIMLSGYENNIYKKLEENGWKKICFQSTIHSTFIGKNKNKTKHKKLDCIWINY